MLYKVKCFISALLFNFRRRYKVDCGHNLLCTVKRKLSDCNIYYVHLDFGFTDDRSKDFNSVFDAIRWTKALRDNNEKISDEW